MSLKIAENARWVRAWYAAPTKMIAAGLSGRTFRQELQLHAGGEQVRLLLSNRYGENPVTLTSLSVAAVASMFDPAEDHVVRFSSKPTVTMPAGQDIVSDPVPMRVKAFARLWITFFLAEGDCMTGHGEARQTSYLSGMGNIAMLPKAAQFMISPLKAASWWLISGVDVVPMRPINCLVAFGSSTTDGTGSTQDANRRWPDYLARRLAESSPDRFMSVVNAGIAANLLTEYKPDLSGFGFGAFQMPDYLFGETGLRRMQWDVLAQPGATDLIVHIGSNDLRVGVSAPTLIEAFQLLSKGGSEKIPPCIRHDYFARGLSGSTSRTAKDRQQMVARRRPQLF